MSVKSKRGKEKKKAKKWYPVTAPEMFKEQVIGEIPSHDISKLTSKKLSINLMSATRDFKHQDTTLIFTITGISGQTAQSQLWAYKISPSSLKRLVRRKTDRIDIRVPVKIKDNKEAIMKLVIVTLSNTYNAVRTKIREAAIKHIQGLCKSSGFVELVQQLTNNRFQKELRHSLNKLYPIRYIVVREFKLVSP